MIKAADESETHRLRIVHYLPGVPAEEGGVVRAVLDWCAILAQSGHEVKLLVYGERGLPPAWKEPAKGTPQVVVMQTPSLPGRPLSRASMRTAARVIEECDVLHLHGPWIDGNRQLANLARARNVPYIVSTHGMLDDWTMARGAIKKRAYMRLFGKRLMQGAARVHCTADREEQQVRPWIGRARSVVLPYLVDLKSYRDLPPAQLAVKAFPVLAGDEFKILFLSRLHEQKGLDVLIDAAATLQASGLRFHLLIAGTGQAAYEANMRRRVKDGKLQSRVSFLGLVTGATKLALYRAADVLVLPTRQENFGLVLVEAMACGTPVITTRQTDIWQEIERGGAIVTDGSAAAVAQAIGAAMLNRSALARRGAAARSWVMDWLDPAKLTAAYEQLYREVAGCGRIILP